MAVLDIQTGDIPILRQKAKQVNNIDDNVLQLIEDMFETMAAASGIGLAAPQIGVSKRLIVADISSHSPDCPPIALINPSITEVTGEELAEERCLSLPGHQGIVRRASSVTVQALLPNGEETELNGSHLMARVLQHEIDHLDGILFIDLLKSEDQELLEEEEAREAIR
jgi:peptide deformylase